jgi:hypothetical protein
MKNVVIFYDHLGYFMVIWHNVLQFGVVSGHLVYFSHFGMSGPRKIWQPCSRYEPANHRADSPRLRRLHFNRLHTSNEAFDWTATI